jgi:hypothetical protein
MADATDGMWSMRQGDPNPMPLPFGSSTKEEARLVEMIAHDFAGPREFPLVLSIDLGSPV